MVTALAPDLQRNIDEIANRWPAVGLAAGVIRDGRLDAFAAHGLEDIASATPVTEDTVFRIASVTKTFTAIAVMQLWEQGSIDLDEPADAYLLGIPSRSCGARLPTTDRPPPPDAHRRDPRGPPPVRPAADAGSR